MYMYFSDVSWQPTGSTEHGELITPPRPLADVSLNDSDAQFRKIWSLVVVTGNDCPEECIIALENIRQVRLSLGPKIPRFQTVLLYMDDAPLKDIPMAEHPKLIVADPEVTAGLLDTFGPYENGEVFMVDPLGNLMMRYASGTEMGDIRKDIAHLLKLSGIG
jgi:hypothetical protein